MPQLRATRLPDRARAGVARPRRRAGWCSAWRPRAAARRPPSWCCGSAPAATTPPSAAPGTATSRAGFDIAVARAYAQERGLGLEFVRFRWPDLARDLAAGRFDVAMSGVTVRPRRSLAGRFSVPVVESGAVLLLREPGRFATRRALDRPDLRIGVNAGGYLEQVAQEHFPRATLVAIADNAAVREALLAGDLDAAVTDSLEAPHWKRGAEELGQSAPFTRDRKAYLVRADHPTLAADLDRWLLDREADGSLAKLRREHLGDAAEARTATPLAALVAAMDERLALMPLVAAAKRRAGLPLEVPEREAAGARGRRHRHPRGRRPRGCRAAARRRGARRLRRAARGRQGGAVERPARSLLRARAADSGSRHAAATRAAADRRADRQPARRAAAGSGRRHAARGGPRRPAHAAPVAGFDRRHRGSARQADAGARRALPRPAREDPKP